MLNQLTVTELYATHWRCQIPPPFSENSKIGSGSISRICDFSSSYFIVVISYTFFSQQLPVLMRGLFIVSSVLQEIRRNQTLSNGEFLKSDDD